MIFAIRRAIGAFASWLPFQTLCFQQAIAECTMLEPRGIGSVLDLSVRDPSKCDGIEDHAWLDAGELTFTGYTVDPALTEVTRFV